MLGDLHSDSLPGPSRETQPPRKVADPDRDVPYLAKHRTRQAGLPARPAGYPHQHEGCVRGSYGEGEGRGTLVWHRTGIHPAQRHQQTATGCAIPKHRHTASPKARPLQSARNTSREGLLRILAVILSLAFLRVSTAITWFFHGSHTCAVHRC